MLIKPLVPDQTLVPVFENLFLRRDSVSRDATPTAGWSKLVACPLLVAPSQPCRSSRVLAPMLSSSPIRSSRRFSPGSAAVFLDGIIGVCRRASRDLDCLRLLPQGRTPPRRQDDKTGATQRRRHSFTPSSKVGRCKRSMMSLLSPGLPTPGARPAAASPASFLRGRVGLAGQAEGKHQNAGCQPGHTGRSDGT